jgi:anaerobic magnesium-protoporphyrin IX monomethyl ester cyclase
MQNNVKKILLINPPGKITITKEGSRERKLAVPPLGLASLATNLRKEDLEVEILDSLIEGYENEQGTDSIIYGLNPSDISKKISDFNPDMVGISCLFSNRIKEVLDICKTVRQTALRPYIVLGGQHPSGTPSLIKNTNIDYILKGESDDSLVDLVRAINGTGDVSNVDGIVTKKGSFPKKYFPDVNELPLPSWDLVNLKKYWNVGVSDYETSSDKEKKFMVMMTSRGCPHNCSFCTSTLMSGRKYRLRNLDSVLSEITKYKQDYGVNEIHFWDDNFFANTNRTKLLLKSLIKEFPNTNFQVPSGSEINKVDSEIIGLLSEAGFKKLFLAVESPNASIQKDYIDKRVDLDRVYGIVKEVQKAGLIAEGSFMVGFPGETKEQIDAAFKRATEYNFDRISISIVNPLPGTPLYNLCKRKKLFYDDFDPSDIRWSNENIKLEGVERGYISEIRRKIWKEYMASRINVNEYENEGLNKK